MKNLYLQINNVISNYNLFFTSYSSHAATIQSDIRVIISPAIIAAPPRLSMFVMKEDR